MVTQKVIYIFDRSYVSRMLTVTNSILQNEKKEFVGDTKCEKIATEMCGRGCSVVELKEQCKEDEVNMGKLVE